MMQETRSILLVFLCEHFRKQVCLIIFKRCTTDSGSAEIMNASSIKVIASRRRLVVILVVVTHETQYIGQARVDNFIVFLLHKFFPINYAVVPIERSFAGFRIS